MKYCLICRAVESVVILMNRAFYFFIHFIVLWLGTVHWDRRLCVGRVRFPNVCCEEILNETEIFSANLPGANIETRPAWLGGGMGALSVQH